MIPLAAFALAGCLVVGGGSGAGSGAGGGPAAGSQDAFDNGSDQILAKDLVPAFPALAGVAPDTPLALAPFPGVPRIFHVPELVRMAERLKAAPAPESEICIQRPVAVLEPAHILEAMQRALPAARIEILEFSRQPAPLGPLEFPVAGLRQGTATGYWNGFVRYGAGHRFRVWAKVKVVVRAPRVVADGDLKPGRPLDAAQLRMEIREEVLTADAFATSIDEVAGRTARRSIPAGVAIRLPWLEAAKDVLRGDTVRVEVTNGGAHLAFDALAEASGSAGEIIPVLNPESKKRFPARVEGKGRASVKGTI